MVIGSLGIQDCPYSNYSSGEVANRLNKVAFHVAVVLFP